MINPNSVYAGGYSYHILVPRGRATTDSNLDSRGGKLRHWERGCTDSRKYKEKRGYFLRIAFADDEIITKSTQKKQNPQNSSQVEQIKISTKKDKKYSPAFYRYPKHNTLSVTKASCN